eukprot:6211112-Pleurochrysis_carterae.AAC.2
MCLSVDAICCRMQDVTAYEKSLLWSARPRRVLAHCSTAAAESARVSAELLQHGTTVACARAADGRAGATLIPSPRSRFGRINYLFREHALRHKRSDSYKY